MAVVRPKPLKKNDAKSILFEKFDLGLLLALEAFSSKMNSSCDKLESKLVACEKKMMKYCDGIRSKTERELDIAESIVNREMRSKVVMSQWINGFLARTHELRLDPVTFAFSRFSLNVALCYNDVPASYFITSKVHHLLVSLLSFDSDIVIGPSLMALLHLSLHEEMKIEIFNAGVLPLLLKMMVRSRSMTILAQSCRLCASLACSNFNKPYLSNSGCFHAILDLAACAKFNVDDDVISFACCAITNIIHDSDMNRTLSIELDAIRPLVHILKTSSFEPALVNAIKSLANIAYTNGYTAGRILESGGDIAILDVLSGSDIVKQMEVTAASLVLLANLCNSDMNQSHVASSKGKSGYYVHTRRGHGPGGRGEV